MAGRRILIDGSMAKRGGGFTYLVNIVPQLAQLAPEDRFRIVVADEKVADSIPAADNVEVTYLGELGTRGRFDYTYRQAGRMARKWGADLYFSAGELAPLDLSCPMVCAFRNPNVFDSNRGYEVDRRQKLRFSVLWGLSRASAARARRVMFVSEDSAAWIGDSIKLPERKRAVIHHGMDHEKWRRGSVDGNHSSYILSVSSIYPYKNYVRLIEAYADLFRRRPDVPELVIIGDDQDAAYSRQMAEARTAAGDASHSVHILGEVPYAEIRRYYADAALFAFPSYLETFGHPLIEAMASEIPVVAADIPVFRELAQDAAFYADPFEAKSISAAMEEALYTPGASELLVKRGRERARQCTWQRSAEGLLDLFGEVIAEAA
jgi:glycosyltransferase involved in cell wall biosynthesis